MSPLNLKLKKLSFYHILILTYVCLATYSTIHSTRIQISYIYVKNMLVLKQAGTGVHVGAHMYAVCTPNPTPPHAPPQPKNLQTGF